MTNMQLLEAIGMINEETVADAEQHEAPQKTSRRLLRQICAVAACTCLLLGSAVAVQMGGWGGAEDTACDNGSAITNAEDGASDKLAGVPMDGADITAAITGSTTVTDAHAGNGNFGVTQATMMTETEGSTCGGYLPILGRIVYREDFDDYDNTPLTVGIPSALAWTELTQEYHGVYGESEVLFAIHDGRLYFRHSHNDACAYFAIDMLDDDYMMSVVMGKYSLQYDLTYLSATSLTAHASLITELSKDGQCYNQFAFRISGIASHRCHFHDSWKTFSAYDPATDLNPEADDPSGAEGTPLLTKLTGLDLATYGDSPNFESITVTVRLQWDPEDGHLVYMKTAAMTDFVKVSESSDAASGIMYLGWEGYAVAFKVQGTVEGYLDNISIWTGWGDEPSESAEWIQPPK